MVKNIFHGILFFIVQCVLIFTSCYAQNSVPVRFVFYNVENLFDVTDDSLTLDEAFTPEGENGWSIKRYHEKLDNIAKTLTALGEWELPALLALCEVENRDVLYDLAKHRLLEGAGYKIIHQNSPDRRGIDVGLLYMPAFFTPIISMWIPIEFNADPKMHTRDILYVKGLLFQTDTIHLFINHWPSRWGGVEASMPKRVAVANILRAFTDSIFKADGKPNILIAGDLNDNPDDTAVYKVLGARSKYDGNSSELYNLMFPLYLNEKKGSMKYKADWEVYDQIIVSGSLLDNTGLKVKDGKAVIFSAEFLLKEDERYLGMKPYRTYAGPSYLGGFSDHLPVYIDLSK
ncbi:MAG: hypothetical protein IMY74_04535 [Bacteroidetes bacterium]|nr:hypothetical protein [Bacteroidota bacterium]MCK5764334.1 endonuclease [Bacteroidales bacterium]